MGKFSEIIVRNIKLPYKTDKREAIEIAVRKVERMGFGVLFSNVCKRSVDARDKKNILFVYSVYLKIDGKPSEKQLSALDGQEITGSEISVEKGSLKTEAPPCIVGMGPAGLFCGVELAKHGYKPIILERGQDVFNRKKTVYEFFQNGILDENSNVQFGAGGAGTFSDGKLVTRINDPLGKYILETFVRFGAPEEILWQAKPHIGTDLLLTVVDNMEKYIISMGGRVYYNTTVSGILYNADGSVVPVTNGVELSCSALVLAIGHSSRDTYQYLIANGYEIAPKDFSCGLRIEHLTKDIDYAMYGDADIEILGHGEYTLSHREGERGVYTFCMCPGGEVVAAASERGGVVVNGMSNYARNGVNSNSAIAVSVLKSDYGNHPLKAIEFQRRLERAAFEMGGEDYSVPVQTVGDFLAGGCNGQPSVVYPTYMNGSRWRKAELKKGMPSCMSEMLDLGIRKFDKKIKGFGAEHAILSGYETRTSAPLRILRNDDMTAVGRANIYPCGEGAGYAGGITSAAIDGVRTALAIMKKFAPDAIK